MLAEKYILLDSLLFKIVSSPQKETAALAIPEVCADKNNYFVPPKSICRTSESDKNLPNNK